MSEEGYTPIFRKSNLCDCPCIVRDGRIVARCYATEVRDDMVEACNAFPKQSADLSTLRAELERVKGLCQESLTLFERMDYDHDCPLCNFPRTKGNHTCELTTLMHALAAALAERGESEDANQ